MGGVVKTTMVIEVRLDRPTKNALRYEDRSTACMGAVYLTKESLIRAGHTGTEWPEKITITVEVG